MQKNLAVSAEFPDDLLPLLRCSRDGGPLSIEGESLSGSFGIIEARLRCANCGCEFRIEDGIARLMIDSLSAEDEHERTIRDQEHFYTYTGPFVPPESGWRSVLMDHLEIPPHLAALQPLRGRTVLELGCGDGRFTMLMAGMEARVLAVDFSISALRQMAQRLPTGIAPTAYQPGGRLVGTDLRGRVGLVHASINHLHIRPSSFERVLSATPLDTRDERMAMYRTIADALTADGRVVSGVEHDDLMRRTLGLPLLRRYSKDGILIEHFDIPAIRRELSPYFLKFRARQVRPNFPFVRRLPLSLALLVSRCLGVLPFFRQFGELLMVQGERPIRLPVEGESRPGSRLARTLFRWYTRRLGKEGLWGTDEIVQAPSQSTTTPSAILQPGAVASDVPQEATITAE